MAKQVFHSFYYAEDVRRVNLVRNMGVIEGQPVLPGNEWEKVERSGDAGIKRWINEQMRSKFCVVVLIGRHTAGRRWVEYEICTGWEAGKGVVGVYIHALNDPVTGQSTKGANP